MTAERTSASSRRVVRHLCLRGGRAAHSRRSLLGVRPLKRMISFDSKPSVIFTGIIFLIFAALLLLVGFGLRAPGSDERTGDCIAAGVFVVATALLSRRRRWIRVCCSLLLVAILANFGFVAVTEIKLSPANTVRALRTAYIGLTCLLAWHFVAFAFGKGAREYFTMQKRGDETSADAPMTTDRAVFLFRLQYTCFCLFYAGLLFLGVIYFRQRMSFITDAVGTAASLPPFVAFARNMHHPFLLLLAGLAPVFLVPLAWTIRPNGFLLLGQATLMLLLVLIVFIAPVATELMTASILDAIHRKAIERGIIK